MWEYYYIFLFVILMICLMILLILLKILKKISIKKDSVLCEFDIYELFWISSCLNDEMSGIELEIENLKDEYILSSSDVQNCEDTYSQFNEVNKLKNKVDYYMDQISKK